MTPWINFKMITTRRKIARFLSTRTKAIVSSWNEWDPLEEVVVGIADGSAVPPLHPAEEAKIFHLPHTKNNVGLRDAEKIKRANAQLDGFADILRKHNVIVQRPKYVLYRTLVLTQTKTHTHTLTV